MSERGSSWMARCSACSTPSVCFRRISVSASQYRASRRSARSVFFLTAFSRASRASSNSFRWKRARPHSTSSEATPKTVPSGLHARKRGGGAGARGSCVRSTTIRAGGSGGTGCGEGPEVKGRLETRRVAGGLEGGQRLRGALELHLALAHEQEGLAAHRVLRALGRRARQRGRFAKGVLREGGLGRLERSPPGQRMLGKFLAQPGPGRLRVALELDERARELDGRRGREGVVGKLADETLEGGGGRLPTLGLELAPAQSVERVGHSRSRRTTGDDVGIRGARVAEALETIEGLGLPEAKLARLPRRRLEALGLLECLEGGLARALREPCFAQEQRRFSRPSLAREAQRS